MGQEKREGGREEREGWGVGRGRGEKGVRNGCRDEGGIRREGREGKSSEEGGGRKSNEEGGRVMRREG